MIEVKKNPGKNCKEKFCEISRKLKNRKELMEAYYRKIIYIKDILTPNSR